MIFEGTVHTFGRDVDTDVIIPARYLNTNDPDELASHCMEDIDAEFVKRVKKGDILAEQGKTADARAAYKLALEKLGDKSSLKPLLEIRLDALGG